MANLRRGLFAVLALLTLAGTGCDAVSNHYQGMARRKAEAREAREYFERQELEYNFASQPTYRQVDGELVRDTPANVGLDF